MSWERYIIVDILYDVDRVRRVWICVRKDRDWDKNKSRGWSEQGKVHASESLCHSNQDAIKWRACVWLHKTSVKTRLLAVNLHTYIVFQKKTLLHVVNLELCLKCRFLHKNVQQTLVNTSQQNLYKWFQYSLINSLKWFHVSRMVRYKR